MESIKNKFWYLGEGNKIEYHLKWSTVCNKEKIYPPWRLKIMLQDFIKYDIRSKWRLFIIKK
jgi:hypothetical protein